jgi:hypothetical protein
MKRHADQSIALDRAGIAFFFSRHRVPCSNGKLVRGPMVGRWRLEGQDVLVNWESWNEAKRPPWQVEERLQVRQLNEGSLTLQVIPPRQPAEGRTLEFKRFAGWDKRE